jgi:hypothetical protein
MLNVASSRGSNTTGRAWTMLDAASANTPNNARDVVLRFIPDPWWSALRRRYAMRINVDAVRQFGFPVFAGGAMS